MLSVDEDKIKKVSAGHTVYKLKDGTRVPGASTVAGLLGKPQLVRWANKLGLEGIDCGKYTDESAAVGTLAHAMIIAHIKGERLNTEGYSPMQVDLAENSLISFFDWLKRHSLTPIFCEQPFTSEKLRFGGTPDCYCLLDGESVLLDFKTGKSIYGENLVQIAAYKQLVEERGYPVNACIVLRVGRDEDEGFEEHSVGDCGAYLEIFKKLLDVYYLKKAVKWG